MARHRDDRRGNLPMGRRKVGGLLGELHRPGGLLGDRREVRGLLGNGPAVTLASSDALRREQPGRGLVGMPGASPYALQGITRGLQNTMGFFPSINPTSGAERTERLMELRAALSGLMQEKGAAGSTATVGDIDRFVGRPADTKSFSLADQISALGDATDDAMVGTSGQDHHLRQQRTVRQVPDERNPIASGSGRAVRGLLGNVSPGRFAPYELPRHEQLAQGRAGLAGVSPYAMQGLMRGLEDTSGFPPSVGLTPEAEETEQLKSDNASSFQEFWLKNRGAEIKRANARVEQARVKQPKLYKGEISTGPVRSILLDGNLEGLLGGIWNAGGSVGTLPGRTPETRDHSWRGLRGALQPRGLLGPVDGVPKGELKRYDPSLRQSYKDLINDALRWFGANPHTAQHYADGIIGLAELSPVGILTAADDARRAYNRGDYVETGLAALGAIPMYGKAGKGLRKTPKDWRPTLFEEVDEIPDLPQHDLLRHDPPQGVSERVGDAISDPKVRKQVLEVFERGIEMGGHHWHKTAPARSAFVKELDKEAGNRDFRLFLDLFAASSPVSNVGRAIREASYYYYYRIKQGLGAPEVGSRNDWPYGHPLQELHQQLVHRVVGGKGWDSVHQPKSSSLAENLDGNLRPIALDMHGMRLLGILSKRPLWLIPQIREKFARGEISMNELIKQPAFWESRPRPNDYGAVERYVQDLAAEVGLEPAQAQAAGWVGGGRITGLKSDPTLPWLGFLEDRIIRTAAKRQILAKDVIPRFVTGEFPLWTVGGLVLGGAAAADALRRANRDESRRDLGRL
jgi:hypothetical protein